MRVAVLSDIHGNARALEATLAAARGWGAERLLVLGDVVGYYYRPDRALELLSAWKRDVIRGNHEDLLAAARRDPAALAAYGAKYGGGFDAALATLSAAQLDELETWPTTREVTLAGARVVMSHGCPADHDQYVYPDADEALLARCVVPGADVVLMGHTHRAFGTVRDGVLLLNPGSVGQARDVGGLASWLLLDTARRAFLFQRTPYDAAALAREVRERDPGNAYLADILTRAPGQIGA